MNQIYTSGRFIRRGLGCNCRPGFGDDYTDAADGGGGYYETPPVDSGSDYGGDYYGADFFDSPYYGSDYYDWVNGIYYDQYGNAWDAIGSGIFGNQDNTADGYDPNGNPDNTADGYDPNGNPVLRISTDVYGDPTGTIDLNALGQTINWWSAINADPSLPPTLPAVPVSIPLILQIPDWGIPPPGLNLPPAVNALPPSTLAKIKQALKQIAQNGKATGGASPSGASAGSKPQAVQPSQTGTCPPGYTLNAAKTACLLNQQPPGAGTGFMQLLQNPLVWILVLGAVVVSKR